MKHVFCIHSSITYLVMRGVINYKNINPKDVIVFTRRGYSFYWKEVKSYNLSSPIMFLPNTKNIAKKIIQYLLFFFKFSLWILWIKAVTGWSKFELYIPGSGPLEWNLLSEKFFSKIFYNIEEGSVYYKQDIIHKNPTTVPFKDRILYFGILKTYCSFKKEAKTSFVFSNEIIKLIPNPFVLNLKGTILSLNKKDSKKEIIIAIDGGSTFNQVFDLSQHIKVINEVALEIKKKYSEKFDISFKLHPNQYNSEIESNTFRNLLKHHFPNITEQPKETILEIYLCNDNKIIYAGDSSLSLYAYLLNRPINSFLFKFSNICDSLSLEKIKKRYSVNYFEYLKKNQI